MGVRPRPIRRGGADVAAQIRKLVASGACRWRDIAVAARSMEVYGPVIESVFQRDGIPAYISRRSDILEKPPHDACCWGRWTPLPAASEREDMFRYLKTGMAGITAEECDLLENYVILLEHPGQHVAAGHGVDGKPRRLRAGDDRRSAQPRLAEVNRIRQKVRSTLLPLSDGLKDRHEPRPG